MQKNLTINIKAKPKQLFDVVADLETYPEWLELVDNVQTGDSQHQSAWLVTLKARLGPISRSKKLRMVKSVNYPKVEFERAETLTKDFSQWKMLAEVSESSEGSTVNIELSYGGRFWSSTLEKVMESQIERVAKRLESYVNEDT